MITKPSSVALRLLLLSLALAFCLAAPAYAGSDWFGGGNWTSGDEGNPGKGTWGIGDKDGGRWGGEGGPGPAIPEPSGWLLMGAGLVAVGPYIRRRRQPKR